MASRKQSRKNLLQALKTVSTSNGVLRERIRELENQVIQLTPHSSYQALESCLETARKIVYGRGEKEYGHPAKNFAHTADLWNAQFQNILGDGPANKFTPEDVAYAMILVKLSRQEHMPKRDNIVDICGYAETAQRVIDKGRIPE